MATDLTADEFRTMFSYFGNLPDAVLNVNLELARAQCDSEVWGDMRSYGIGFLTAHYCALNPRAEDMRLQKDKNGPSTWYYLEWKKLTRRVAGGARVSGTPSEINEIERLLNRQYPKI